MGLPLPQPQIVRLPSFLPPVKDFFIESPSRDIALFSKARLRYTSQVSSSPCLPLKVPSQSQGRGISPRASRTRDAQPLSSDDEDDSSSRQRQSNANAPYLMPPQERMEWRRNIKEVMQMCPDGAADDDDGGAAGEELDPEEKKAKVEKLISDYSLVVEEDDPDWPEDADGWGFGLSQFFDKITIKNKKKDDDDEDYDSDEEIVWQDDNFIRAVKDVTLEEWEETVFENLGPLVLLVHNRYRRPKENEKIRVELEKAINIIWDCKLPAPRCLAIDAAVETELVSALKVSVFPEVIFTKTGKILYREKAVRSADEFSKIMAFFYAGAAKPPFLDASGDAQEFVPIEIE
ncbi:Thioredoxin-like fold domain-containing protein mrl7l, chloroplastic [Turnera subulata]|uniref:Thioredoxin-like fold domain-containing protein mrl7l, chloroplastic n=1 Tax=Turnera subulata TaxID=218843 RepID=A0A9Q0G8I7_9ROSI|nr:Thioredoxin-like fold domain-containing protein mrl7l, chloroplastic [Turnera subulata]